jgi:FAD-dependent urate hydroxylase
MNTTPPMPHSLSDLEAALRRDLDLLDYPRRPWLTPRRTTTGANILDTLIIGGGQSGLTLAFSLMRERVDNLLALDIQEENQEGPWRSFARMITLRTPKYLTGPDTGIPSLTIRAWYEAQHGAASWEALGLIPKETWADYLHWYRTTLCIPVRNNARAGALHWEAREQCWTVPVTDTKTGRTETLWARTVVLATGIEGSGRWQIPSIIAQKIPPHLWAHTHQDIPFADLNGKRIGVLGAGACAFDNAAVALEHGAARVDQFYRRPTMVRVNPYRWAEFVGFLKHHADLSDADRWRFIRQILRIGQLPPADTYRRATRFPSHYLHANSPWLEVAALPGSGGAQITTPHGTWDFDFLILGTGFVTDLSLRPELAELHEHIALWRDRYTPPAGEEHEDLSRHPYLGSHFEFTEKTPGTIPPLNTVFNYTFGCLLSMGFGGASISGMKYSLPRIVAGITRYLYQADSSAFYSSLCAYDTEEF